MSTGPPSSSGSTVSVWSSSADILLTRKCQSDVIKLMICFLRRILVFSSQEQQPQSFTFSKFLQKHLPLLCEPWCMSVNGLSEKQSLIKAFDWLLAAVQRRCCGGTDVSTAGTTAQRQFEYVEGLSVSSWM